MADRIDEHLRNFLSGYYYIYNIHYLNEACRNPAEDTKRNHIKYIYGPPKKESFAGEFLPRLTGGLVNQIVQYLQNLTFFLAPIPNANKDTLLRIEAVLTEMAYSGEAKHVIDSPRPREIDSQLKENLEIFFEADVSFKGLVV